MKNQVYNPFVLEHTIATAIASTQVINYLSSFYRATATQGGLSTSNPSVRPSVYQTHEHQL